MYETEEALARRIQDLMIQQRPILLLPIQNLVEQDKQIRQQIKVIVTNFLPSSISNIVMNYVRAMAIDVKLKNDWRTGGGARVENSLSVMFGVAMDRGENTEDIRAVVLYCLNQGAEINDNMAWAVRSWGYRNLKAEGEGGLHHLKMVQDTVVPFLKQHPNAPMASRD